MLSRGLVNLRGGREMNEAVADIDGATPEHALPLRLAPGRSRAALVDLTHEGLCPLGRAALAQLAAFGRHALISQGRRQMARRFRRALSGVVRFLAVEDALEGRAVPLRRGKSEIE